MTTRARLGPFELRRPIARGGMGEVWLAHHVAQDLPVAVKLLFVDERSSPEAFRVEARATAALDHPDIVLIIDFGEVDRADAAGSGGLLKRGQPWIAMEYVAGGTLASVARDATWTEARRFLRCTLDALAHAHARGVIHRDLKAGNVLRDTAGRYKLTDFGIAHVLGEVDGPVAATSGTPSVMAPEQFEGRWRDFGPWTDLYALGALTWMLVTGARPYPGKTWAEQRQGHLLGELPAFVPRFPVPEGLDAWVRRLLQRDPAHRWRCAADAAWALSRLLDPPEPVDAASTDLPELDPTTLLMATTDEPSVTHTGTRDWVEARRLAAPMPGAWRGGDVAPRPAPIVGAGLSLWGLRTLRLVGREQERGRLWEALANVRRRNRCELILVRGASGVGKSRLAAWLAERARELGAATVLEAVHEPGGGPGTGLGGMVDRHLVLDALPPDLRVVRTRAVLASMGLDADDDWLARVLSELDDANARRPAVERHGAIMRLLSVLARERPLLLWLDDVQWGPDALAFADRLLGEGLPALVVATVADELLAERPHERARVEALAARPEVGTLEVGPLPSRDRGGLLRELLGLAPDLARRLDETTDGNPMFAIQVVGEWIHHGLLETSPDGFRVARGASLRMPRDLRESWNQRLDRFLAHRPATDADALGLAALLGRHVDGAEWRAACTVRGIQPSEGFVEVLLARRLATAEDPRAAWSFVHGMLREAAELRLDGERRAALHLACAAAVVDPARRGRHLWSGGDAEGAVAPLLQGAWLSLERTEPATTTDLLELANRAMDVASVPEDDERRGRADYAHNTLLLQRTDLDRAWTFGVDLRERARRHGWSQLEPLGAMTLGRIALLRWKLDEALALFAEAEPGLSSMPGEQLACLRGMAGALTYQGRLDEAAALLERARHIVPAHASQHVLAGLHLAVATLEWARHDVARTLEEMALCIGHYRRSGDRIGLAAAISTHAAVLRDLGRLDEAEREMVEIAAQVKGVSADLSGILDIGLGLLRALRGAPEEGIALIRAELQRELEVGRALYVPRTRLYLAVALATAGDPEATEMLELACDGLASQAVVHTDTALMLERAARSCAAHGWTAHAERATALASETWRRLGNHARAGAT
ncbi:MAG: protein kinase [Alphaproteobacteria bacterium]|nr:protein kinase [Alphaproteobacteria bacterium]